MQDEEEVVLIANVPGDVEKNSISLKFGPGQNKIDLSCAKIQPNTVVSAEETLFKISSLATLVVAGETKRRHEKLRGDFSQS